MKKLFLYSALLLGIAACGDKGNDPTPTPTPQTTRVTMKVNGTLVEIENVAAWATLSTSHGLGIGTSDYSKNFLMRVHKSDFNTGSAHQLGGSKESIIQYTFKNSSGVVEGYSVGKNFHDSHGSFTLSKIEDISGGTEKKFYGTFSGTLYSPTGNDSIIITEGQIIE